MASIEDKSIKNHNVIIAAPAFNEAENLRVLIPEIKKIMREAEIVVVSDGSTDATAHSARESGATVIDLPINLGVGNAVQAAILYAQEQSASYFVRIDSDLQHDPVDIPRLLQPLISQKADLVIGSRFLSPSGHRSTKVRLFGIQILCGVLKKLLHQDITDPTSGFQAYNRRAMKYLSAHNIEDYPEIENLISCSRAGLRVVEVPVTMRPRRFGRSSISKFRSVYLVIKSILVIIIGMLRKENNV